MTETALPFGSLFIALPTPFDDAGKIEWEVLDHLVEYLLQQKVSGVALLTEAAEEGFLTAHERNEIVERVGGKISGQARNLVAISAPATRAAVDLARLAEEKGATGLLLAPMAVPGLGYRELYRHVDIVAKAISLPLFLSVRPNSPVDLLSDEEKATLVQHSGVSGVFLALASQPEIKVWARRLRKSSGIVLSGCGLTFQGAARAGAGGAVCALSLLALDASRQIMTSIAQADVDKIRKIERRTEPAIAMLGPPRPPEEQPGVKKLAHKIAARPLDVSPNAAWVTPGLIKAGLSLQGHKMVSSRVRPPLEQPSRERLQRLAQVLRSSELLS